MTTETKDNTFEKRREERGTMVDPSITGRLIIGQEVKVSQSRTPFKTGDYKEAGKGCKDVHTCDYNNLPEQFFHKK